MNQALTAILSGLAALNSNHTQARQQQSADQIAAQQLQKDAQAAAQSGDWQWLQDNQENLQQLLHPAILQSIHSTTHRQNQRLYDAQTAEGGPATIPLSPYNQTIMRMNRPMLGYDPRQDMTAGGGNPMMSAIAAVNGGGGEAPTALQGIPNNEVMPPNYGSLYTQPGAPQAPADTSVPTTTPRQPTGDLGDETGMLADLNQQMRTALDQVPSEQPPQAPAQPTVAPAQQEPPVQPPAELRVPSSRKPVNKTQVIQTAIGNQTIHKNIPGITGKEVMASLLSQAEDRKMHPHAVLSAFNKENLRRLQAGEPELEMDEASYKGYQSRHWEQVRTQIQDQLMQRGVPPDQAFAQAAQQAFMQTGHVPEQWMQVVKPHPDQQAAGAYGSAIQQANDQLQQTLSGLKAPLGSVKPGELLKTVFDKPFLLQAIDRTTLPPEARTRALHELASTSHSAYLNAVQQARPDLSPQQQNYLAMSMASKSVGGNVPEQWRAFVEQDMEKLGLVGKEDIAIYQGLPPQARPDPLDPDFGNRLRNIRMGLEMNTDYRKAALGLAKTPEGLAATQQMFQQQQQPPGQPAAEQPPAGAAAGKPGKAAATPTPSSIGQTERSIALKQEGALGQQRADLERKNAIIPTAHLEKLQTADSIYKAGREAQQIAARKDKDGKTIIDKYGDTPGSFRDFWAKIKGSVGRADPVLLAYKNRLAKVYNFERHELTGAATSVYEGSALEPYLPDPGDNVRVGLQKLNNLVTQLQSQLDQKLDQAKADYPRSKYDAFHRHKERQQKELDDVFNEAKQKAGRK